MSTITESLIAARAIAIIRGDHTPRIREIAAALLDGGVLAIEVTMNSPGAVDAIRILAEEYGDRLLVGAGTVIEVEQVEVVADVGARFIVSPDTYAPVIAAARERGLATAPGALTPTEIRTAVRAGADLVKLFPATLGGPDYLRQIRAPLNHVKFVPTGGINAGNVAEYLKAGAVAVGFGSALVKDDFDGSPEAMDVLTARAREIMSAIQAVS